MSFHNLLENYASEENLVELPLYLALMGIMKGAFTFRSSVLKLSRHSRSDGPSYHGARFLGTLAFLDYDFEVSLACLRGYSEF